MVSDSDIRDIQRSLDEIKKQLNEIVQSHRLLSPEHIAQAIGFAAVKSDLEEIKSTLRRVKKI